MRSPLSTSDSKRSRQLQSAAAPAAGLPAWRPATRLAFRFGLVYFLLYPAVLLLQWMRAEVRAESLIADTRQHYLAVQASVILAAMAAAVWSALDRKRVNHERLYSWFRLYLRVVAGVVLIIMGAATAFPRQLPGTTLVEPFGNLSPIHLAQTYMSSSSVYSLATGLAEVMAGVLWIIPLTATLGALLGMALVVNVLMVNLGYDGTQKLLCLNLIVVAAVLAAPDGRRLANLFILHRAVPPASARPLFRNQRTNRIATFLQVALAVIVAAGFIVSSAHFATLPQRADWAPLYGIWSVERFTVDGEPQPLLLTDQNLWQRLFVERTGEVVVQSMASAPRYVPAQIDPQMRSISIGQDRFSYDVVGPTVLLLQSQRDGRPLTVRLLRVDDSQFLLTHRGFHWINEYALNQ